MYTYTHYVYVVTSYPYLAHHGFLVLLLLGDFDWWLLGNRRHQEVHQDVFTIGHVVHRGQQAGRHRVGEQVVVVSDTHKQPSHCRHLPHYYCTYCTWLSVTFHHHVAETNNGTFTLHGSNRSNVNAFSYLITVLFTTGEVLVHLTSIITLAEKSLCICNRTR